MFLRWERRADVSMLRWLWCHGVQLFAGASGSHDEQRQRRVGEGQDVSPTHFKACRAMQSIWEAYAKLMQSLWPGSKPTTGARCSLRTRRCAGERMPVKSQVSAGIVEALLHFWP